MTGQHHCSSCNSQESTQTAIDPVCGMTVSKDTAAGSSTYHGTTYVFCHPGCLKKFEGNPKQYLSKKSQTTNQSIAISGSVAVTGSAAISGADYFCPMHPEIVQNHPGDCPKCGMSLEAQSGDSGAELKDLKRRLIIAICLSLPVVAIHLSEMFIGNSLHIHGNFLHWIEFLITSVVVFFSGSIFFKRAYSSVINRSPNMFTLIALGVGAAFAYSTFATIVPLLLPKVFLDHSGVPYVYFEAAAVITVLTLFGQVLESLSRSRTNDSIQSLLSLAPSTARLVTPDGKEIDVPLEQIKTGDIIRVRPGESVPADGIILDGNSTLDESIITGEPLPVAKATGDKAIGATINNTGSFTMKVEQIGVSSLLGQIIQLCQEAQLTKAPIQQLVDHMASFFVPVVILAALFTMVVWASIGQYAFALLNSIAVLIIACPCALGLATPMSVTVAIGRGAHSGILIKEARSLQLLKSVDTVVVDKTGTLTEGKPQVSSIITCGALTQQELLCLVGSVELQSEHPLASAILHEARTHNLILKPCTNFWSTPGKGIGATIDGHNVIIGNARLMDELSISIQALTQAAEQLSKQGHSVLFMSIDKQAAGLISVTDPIKATTGSAIKDLKKQNINVVMLTGDNKITASAVAQQLGITEIYSEVLPTDKAAIVKQLQASGHKVAMAGDGINDSPALTQADVGIAMGTGTDIAMKQASIVLVKGDLQGIARVIKLSNATMNNIHWNLLLAFGYNIVAIPIAAGVLYPMFGLLLNPMIASLAMSLSSVSVIANSLRLRRVDLTLK